MDRLELRMSEAYPYQGRIILVVSPMNILLQHMKGLFHLMMRGRNEDRLFN